MVNDDKPKFSLFWGIYGQIAAIFGALSLLVFVGHFFDVGLKGVLRDAVQWWIDNVRPVVGAPVQWLINQLPESWRFELSPLWKDYLGVGVVSALAFVRAMFRMVPSVRGGMPLVMLLLFGLGIVLAWPAWTIFGIVGFLVLSSQGEADATIWVMALSPLIYLGLALAANEWLL